MATSQSDVSATTTEGQAPAGSFSLDIERRGIPDAVRDYVRRLRTGDPGGLPSVLGLILLGLIFWRVTPDRFLTLNNIGNLPGQGAYIAIIGLGLVFVLLLGEIDLSAGTTGGMCAGFAAQAILSHNLHGAISAGLYWGLIVAMAVAIPLALWLKAYTGAAVVALGLVLVATNQDKHVVLGLLTAVCIGAAVGVYNGWLVAKIGIPSFVATLALFLAWQGVLQLVLNAQPVNTNNYQFWYGLANENMSPLWSWVFTIVVVAGYLLFTVFKSINSRRKRLASDAMSLVLLRAGVIAVAAVVITFFANKNRNTNPFLIIEGLPWALTVPVTLMIVCTLALTKTTWGRHLYATGGNAEAARRAGIDVVHIKVTAFILCSAFGALGAVFLASNSHSASLDLGAGNILLFSVAAAVIGGTSLFGGRGKPRDAIIGALVIVMIPNGLGLPIPPLPPQYQLIITGAVLLVAAGVDALARRHARAG